MTEKQYTYDLSWAGFRFQTPTVNVVDNLQLNEHDSPEIVVVFCVLQVRIGVEISSQGINLNFSPFRSSVSS